MGELSRLGRATANELTIANGSCLSDTPGEKSVTSIRGSDDPDWFAKVARQLLPSDSGFALHTLTGIPESTCYRYARLAEKGGTQPPAGVFLRLLWRDDGSSWLRAAMEGCEAKWWLDHQQAERIHHALKAELRE